MSHSPAMGTVLENVVAEAYERLRRQAAERYRSRSSEELAHLYRHYWDLPRFTLDGVPDLGRLERHLVWMALSARPDGRASFEQHSGFDTLEWVLFHGRDNAPERMKERILDSIGEIASQDPSPGEFTRFVENYVSLPEGDEMLELLRVLHAHNRLGQWTSATNGGSFQTLEFAPVDDPERFYAEHYASPTSTP